MKDCKLFESVENILSKQYANELIKDPSKRHIISPEEKEEIDKFNNKYQKKIQEGGRFHPLSDKIAELPKLKMVEFSGMDRTQNRFYLLKVAKKAFKIYEKIKKNPQNIHQ